MTDLLTRPLLRVQHTDEPPRRPVTTTALLAVCAVALAGLVVCVAAAVIGWFAADTGGVADAMRVGALAWLVAGGGGLYVQGVAITAVPLGAVAVAGWVLYRAGRWVGDMAQPPTVRGVAAGAAVMAAGYGGVGALVWFATRSADVHTDLFRSVAIPALLAAVAGGLGVLVGSGLGHLVFHGLPEAVRSAMTGAAAGVMVLVGAGALLLAGSLIAHFGLATQLAEGMQAGFIGGVLLTFLGVALVPNAVLYAGAYLAGPGFTFGTGTSVSPDAVQLGPMPDFPLLAAVPTGSPHAWQSALIVVPVLAGAVAGLVAIRRYPVYAADHAALRGALAGLAGGVGYAAATWCATGSLGPGRLQDAGPDVLGTLFVCSVSLLLGGAVTAGGIRFLQRRPPRTPRARGVTSSLLPWRR